MNSKPMRFGPGFCQVCGFTHAGECQKPWIFDPKMFEPSQPSDKEMLAVYRDIFAELTAKAAPIEFDANDPERIMAYRIPCGPLHRAAGKLGFQMFNGEAYLAAAVARIRELETELTRGNCAAGRSD